MSSRGNLELLVSGAALHRGATAPLLGSGVVVIRTVRTIVTAILVITEMKMEVVIIRALVRITIRILRALERGLRTVTRLQVVLFFWRGSLGRSVSGSEGLRPYTETA